MEAPLHDSFLAAVDGPRARGADSQRPDPDPTGDQRGRGIDDWDARIDGNDAPAAAALNSGCVTACSLLLGKLGTGGRAVFTIYCGLFFRATRGEIDQTMIKYLSAAGAYCQKHGRPRKPC